MKIEEEQKSNLAHRHVSRLVAIMALYSADVRGLNDLDKASQDVLVSYANKDMFDFDEETKLELELHQPDRLFLSQLLTTYEVKSPEIEGLLKANLIEKYSLEKLERVIKAIIALATLELLYYGETPAKIIIDEYVSLSKSFYGNSEAGFVNKVIDTLARKTRSENEF